MEEEEVKPDNDQGADQTGSGEIAVQASNTVNAETANAAVNQCLEGWIPVDSAYLNRKAAKRPQYRRNRQPVKKKKKGKGKAFKRKVGGSIVVYRKPLFSLTFSL